MWRLHSLIDLHSCLNKHWSDIEDKSCSTEEVAAGEWGEVSLQGQEGRSCKNGCPAYQGDWEILLSGSMKGTTTLCVCAV